MPDWITWSNAVKFLALVPGWIAFIVMVRKLWFERTLLKFTLRATHVQADEDEQSNCYFDGVPVVRAVQINVTNTGQQPITIQRFEGNLVVLGQDKQPHQFKSKTSVENKKIGQGDHCFGYLKIYMPPVEIISACAIDSTGKRWAAPRKSLKSVDMHGLR